MATLSSINFKIGSSWQTLADMTYPVGAYYLSNSSTSPASMFGGTWTQVSDNRFLCGASSVATGGANSQTFTASDLPTHRHGFRAYWTVGPNRDGATDKRCVAYDGFTVDDTEPSNGTASNWNTAGNSKTISKMPLYRSCYMWYRTA